MNKMNELLQAYCREEDIKGKGQLSVVLHVTRYAIENGLPVDVSQVLAGSEGQVKGLGAARIQKILGDFSRRDGDRHSYAASCWSKT